jgi:alpha 1,2-mannosyltransferase
MSIFKRNGDRDIHFELDRSAISELRKYRKDFLKALPPYPGHFSGRGIVICAGGLRYFTCAWVTINMLREKGCTLPIELWHHGNEISQEIKDRLSVYGVVCRDLIDHNPSQLFGCGLKPLSIACSSFQEVLFLDADNICVSNPEGLFETEAYQKYGALFWPDFWMTPPQNPIWAITDSPYIKEQEQESGQLVIDKQRCWKELNLCIHFNGLEKIYHQLLMGDKDTFRFAWKTLKTPYYMIPEEPAVCGFYQGEVFLGTTMIQHDTNGGFYFLHRNLLKWDVTRKMERVWEGIKRFRPKAAVKEYIFSYSPNGHCYMDLFGDTEYIPFADVFPGYEEACLHYLEELRASDFYQRFITYSHFAVHRYQKQINFSLQE